MTAEAKRLAEEALRLPPDERLRLVAELMESVEGDALPEHEVHWAEVAKERLEGIRSGERATVPWAEVERGLLTE